VARPNGDAVGLPIAHRDEYRFGQKYFMATTHRVRQGECLNSIGERYGLLPDTIWLDSGNAELRNLRGDASVLLPGDSLAIPDTTVKQVSGDSDQTHTFVRYCVPALLRLQIKINDEPRANEAYRLIIDGRPTDGTTDGDGFVESPLPPGAERGELRFTKDGIEEIFHLRFGTLDPIDTESGARGRLRSLGYDDSLDLDALMLEFQHHEELEATGQMDDTTLARLKEAFGQ